VLDKHQPSAGFLIKPGILTNGHNPTAIPHTNQNASQVGKNGSLMASEGWGPESHQLIHRIWA